MFGKVGVRGTHIESLYHTNLAVHVGSQGACYNWIPGLASTLIWTVLGIVSWPPQACEAGLGASNAPHKFHVPHKLHAPLGLMLTATSHRKVHHPILQRRTLGLRAE